jgi:hypothetical protein
MTKAEIKLQCQQEAVKIWQIILEYVQMGAGGYLLEEL